MPSRQVEQTFGLLIAFVFPGLIGLYALGLHVPLIQSWFGHVVAPTAAVAAAGTEYRSPTVVEFLLLIIVSAGVGVFLSAVRWAIFEKVLRQLFIVTATEPRKQHDDSSEQSLQGIIMQLYRYYQFYANTSVAVVCFYVAWLARSGVSPAAIGGLLAVLLLAVFLGWSALESWERDQKARQELYTNGGSASVQRT